MTATTCGTSWPEPASIRVHVCHETGDHQRHVCCVCGATRKEQR